MYPAVIRRSRRAAALAGMLCCATLALAACGSSGSSAGAAGAQATISPGAGQKSLAGMPGSAHPATSMPGMAMTPPPAAPAQAPVGGHTVAIKNFAFAPAALKVKAGTTVTWTNQDADAHTVTSQGAGGPLASPSLTTGQTYSYTFAKPGKYAYLCTIHPFMTATVEVTP